MRSSQRDLNLWSFEYKTVYLLAKLSVLYLSGTNTDSPASNKGSLRSSMLECLSFELSSSSAASDCGDDEVFFESFISDDDTSHRID